jgi:hypothetical protein
MEKWNYLTYNRICHDSLTAHYAVQEKNDVTANRSEAISDVIHEAQENNVVVVVVAVDSVEQVITVPLLQAIHNP